MYIGYSINIEKREKDYIAPTGMSRIILKKF
jgi:hypothetical protein